MDELNTYQFYQEMHLWPLTKELNYEQWLKNFEEGEDRKIARLILDFFVYVPDSHVNQMLQTVVGRCGYYFKEKVSDWTHNHFFTDCWYSFIPGETQSFTDSGFIFTRKLREEVGIPDNRILGFDQLLQKIDGGEPIQNIILVDDFVGSGAQCDVAWNKHYVGKDGYTLSKLVQDNNLNVIYAPLIVNDLGKKRIERKCYGLKLEFIHLLKDEYSLFNVDGLCWNGDRVLFDKWCTLFNKICRQENIPLTGGNNVNDGKGFCEQGLAIAFSHGIPDACPAFFYWNSETWKPLIKRHYQYGCKR